MRDVMIGGLLGTLCAACGPGEAERQACDGKKNEARDAYAAYGKALGSEIEGIRAQMKSLSEAAERSAVAEGASGPPDPAAAAAARIKMAPRIALADARRAYVAAVEGAANAAEAISQAYAGKALDGVEAEAQHSSRLDGVATAAERVTTAIRGVSGGEGGAPPAAGPSGLRTTAQSAGQAALAACEELERPQ